MRYKLVLFIFVYHVIISEISRSLGLTYDVISRASSPDIDSDIGALEALWAAFTAVLNNLGSFLQLITLQADLPYIWAALLVYPTSIIMLLIIIELLRGT